MTNRYKLYAIGGIVLTVYLVGFGSGWMLANKAVTVLVKQTTPTVQTVTIEKPVITEKVVKQLVTDPKTREQVNQLLAQNAQLQAKVVALTVTSATSESHGGGVVETVPPSADASPAVVQYHYKDWRLDFTTDTKTASYQLSQRFEVLHTTGRLPNGQPLSLASVYEIGENNERIPLPVTTTSFVTDMTRERWQVGLNVQAGVVYARTLTNGTTSGAVGIQWFSRGRTSAAEDKTLALLTPVVTFGGVKELGVLPISYNLGQVRHQPFKDLWVSPYVGASITLPIRPTRIGISLTSSF